MKKRKGIKWLLLTAVAILFLSGCERLEQRAQDVTEGVAEDVQQVLSNERIPAEFVRHVDGDTTVLRFKGKERKVRLLLIDTPETVKPNTKVQPYGLDASNKTKELLTSASEISFQYDEGDRKDRYGRTLGYVFVDGVLLQETLVREGLARVAYIKEPNTMYLAELKQAQEQAKKQSLGIWSIPGYVTERGFQQ
ncbi:thermonuclease family protein (plasmid) [Enterococcus faecalis]|uniref:thermonuclease family protein n=1 Tax=Enterococcus faecalis TaxID=1351 RepID=UPI0029C9592D|nr:thermonuclease family protein [Enterococcus faecalis]WPH48388.1 thermonuclease family protein [Enterococcus faecalis]